MNSLRDGILNLHLAYVLWDFPTFSQTFVMNELKWLVENNYDVKVFYKMRPDHVRLKSILILKQLR